jgi:glutathione peroxidase
MFAKIEVNGENRHPLYQLLTGVADGENAAGDIQWNFEKFVVSRDGAVIRRFRPMVTPEDPELVGVIEDMLAK